MPVEFRDEEKRPWNLEPTLSLAQEDPAASNEGRADPPIPGFQYADRPSIQLGLRHGLSLSW